MRIPQKRAAWLVAALCAACSGTSGTTGTATTTSATATTSTGSTTVTASGSTASAASSNGSVAGSSSGHGASTAATGATTGAAAGTASAGTSGTATSVTAGSSSGSTAATTSGTSSGSGNTYYVSPTGDDSAAGSKAAPWATIQQAGGVVQPGDTVLVEAGTYDGPIFGWDGPPCAGDPLCVVAGTPGAPIVFEADPSAAAGAVIIAAHNGQNDNGFDLEPGCDYVDIVGFTVTNAGTADQPAGTITKAGIAVSGDGDEILNNTVDGVTGIGGILVNGVDGGLVQGNTCTHVQGTGTTGHGMYLSGSSAWVQVLDNLLDDNDFVGIHINGDVSEGLPGVVSHVLIAGNLIYGNGQNGINADGIESSVIENNVIYGNARNGIELYQIDAYGGSTDNLIVNNTIDQSMVAGGYAIEVSACAYDNQSSQPTPAGCLTSSADTSTGNIAFNDVLLGGAGATAVVASDDLATSNNLSSAATGLFVNAASGNYALAAGGPGIGSGVASFDGASAPDAGNSYDTGAFDFELP